jgi:hypothetical protein
VLQAGYRTVHAVAKLLAESGGAAVHLMAGVRIRSSWPRAVQSFSARLHWTCSNMHAIVAVIEFVQMNIRTQ